jgi:hypothetical protein
VPIDGLEDLVHATAITILSLASQDLLDQLILVAPESTGELKASQYGPIIDEPNLRAVIGFDAPQADYTDLGTQPHEIRGNPRLFFEWQNGPDGPGLYSFHHVQHPGSLGTGWFTDTIFQQWDSFVQDTADNQQ